PIYFLALRFLDWGWGCASCSSALPSMVPRLAEQRRELEARDKVDELDELASGCTRVTDELVLLKPTLTAAAEHDGEDEAQDGLSLLTMPTSWSFGLSFGCSLVVGCSSSSDKAKFASIEALALTVLPSIEML